MDLEQELNGRIAAFERKGAQLLTRATETKTAHDTAMALEREAVGELEAVRAVYVERETVWLAELEKSGLKTAENYLQAVLEQNENQKRRSALVRFQTELESAVSRLEEQRHLLEGRVKPDVEAIKEEYDRADDQRNRLNASVSIVRVRTEAINRDVVDLRERRRVYDVKRVQVDEDLSFAQRLNGRSGVSLQRYVLGVMLTSITVAANQLLKRVHGGRYQLYRTDEVAGSGHKSGLELEVYDSQQNERRSVTTLSGGEKFLVALSLAIGLSTVVQAQGSGVRLEAMFVDEGFGSLDQNSIHDALDVLQSIQRSAGVVGIISHVEQLAETIPTKLQITKESHGSSCKLCC